MNQCIKRINNFNIFNIYIYILLVFFVLPVEQQKIADIILVIISMISVILTWYCKERHGYKIKFSFLDFAIFIFLALVYIMILLISQYSKMYITQNLAFLMVIIYYFYRDNLKLDESKKTIISDSVYWGMCLSLLFQFYICIRNGEDLHLITTWDDNYSGIIIFLFFLFNYKNNKKFGKLITILYIVYLKSRGFVLMIVLFYIIKIFKSFIDKAKNMFFLNKIFKIFIIMIVFIYFFSILWVYNISTSNLKPYKQGINDTSNRIRFLANVRVFDLIKENKSLIMYGYDNDLKKVLGINSEDTAEHQHFNDMRLVQTHNTILSIIIKTGILFSVLYLLIVSKIIDKYYVKENIEYIFPYLINSMYMHSLLNTSFLVFWVLILHIPQKGVKQQKSNSVDRFCNL
ncbi:hypothetical protein [Clostridium algidicarnis]|uniref:O-antigen ligase n=1 Tax=Clostridium algidicarnis DSM 15099 TaxID=1121295 RepID=A0A2S6FVT4_9CLOT|nr:hypothetical protein [Clostridium algidicarnis]PPK46363.1 O-antigen ligase [Clostridium algidicarnis DSM 15099]